MLATPNAVHDSVNSLLLVGINYKYYINNKRRDCRVKLQVDYRRQALYFTTRIY